MSTIQYRGYNVEGIKVTGCKNFKDTKQMETYLMDNNIYNYEIFESQVKYKKGMSQIASAKELSIFCRQMSVLFFSNITLMEGVLLLSEQSENKELKISLKEIYNHMQNGLTFSEAISMYDFVFHSYLINMITIGENSGTLDEVFSKMSEYYDKENKIRKKLKSALTYPLILTTMMAAIVWLLIIKILPMFNDILMSMGGEMPHITKVILSVSNFINKNGLIFAICIVAIFLFVFAYIKTEKGRYWFDKTKVKSKVGKFVYGKVISSRFARSLSILLKSGVQIVNAMEQVNSMLENKYLEEKFKIAFERVKGGTDLADTLKDMGIFPPLFLKMVVIGQTTGHLDEMLSRSANIFDEEVEDALEKTTSMVEPLLIIVLSVIVGIILLSVMLPMISIMTNIS